MHLSSVTAVDERSGFGTYCGDLVPGRVPIRLLARLPVRPKPIRPIGYPGLPRIQLVESKVKEQAAPPLKRTGGRRRKDSRPLLQVELPDLLKDLPVDEDQLDQAGTDARVQAR